MHGQGGGRAWPHFHASFAVYRRLMMDGQWQYMQSAKHEVLNISAASTSTSTDDRLRCARFTPQRNVSVQKDDVLGVCLPPTLFEQLQIVSNTKKYNETTPSLYTVYSTSCYKHWPRMMERIIPQRNLKIVNDIVVHLFAEITSKCVF